MISHHEFPSYTYVIVGSGRVLESKTITISFDDSQSTEYPHRFSFLPTAEYAPKVHVIIYSVRNQMIVSEYICIVLNEFKNFIELEIVPDKAKPSQMIDINVTSNPNSYIGLLAIDKSLMTLRSGNDLTESDIWDAMENCYTKINQRNSDYSYSSYFNAWMDFSVNIILKFNFNSSFKYLLLVRTPT